MEKLIRNTEEVVNVSELEKLTTSGEELKAYVGFEPSGLVHIGWCIVSNKIRDLTDCGFSCIVFLADWHAYINDKYNGDIDKIKACGKYMEDCFLALGVDPKKVKFVYASELIGQASYWEKVLKVAKHTTLARIRRTMTIMGRREDETITDTAKFIYPAMQVADIFELNVNVALGGLDQRKAHMLARDVAEKFGWRKPIAIHTPLLPGLHSGGRMNAIDAKMSKTTPDSCIYIHDTVDEVNRKIRRAYCPERLPEGNPVIDMCKYIIFPQFGKLTIARAERHGGELAITNFDDLVELYRHGKLHPLDLKTNVARYLNEILSPVRKYFEKNPENYERIKEFKPTR
jgi:tyrosyl-tRNA synthetase